MELAKEIYRATELLPSQEKFGLTSQMRRAEVSIPTNIAEGYARNHRKEYLQFLGIAAGSQAELTTLLILAGDVHKLSDTEDLLLQLSNVGRMLTRLRQSLQESNPTP